MVPGIEAFYELVANEMVKNIPSPWRQSRIDAIFYPENSEYHGEYVSQSGKDRSFFVSDKVTRAIRDLRMRFKAAGQRVWGQLTFLLNPDGSFNVKWGYDSCDENGDTIWDPEEWSRQDKARSERLTRE